MSCEIVRMQLTVVKGAWISFAANPKDWQNWYLKYMSMANIDSLAALMRNQI